MPKRSWTVHLNQYYLQDSGRSDQQAGHAENQLPALVIRKQRLPASLAEPPDWPAELSGPGTTGHKFILRRGYI
jgi:hypothetical protein